MGSEIGLLIPSKTKNQEISRTGRDDIARDHKKKGLPGESKSGSGPEC